MKRSKDNFNTIKLNDTAALLSLLITVVLVAVLAVSIPVQAEEVTDFPEVKEAVDEIYLNYQEHNFDGVYDFFHPALQESLSREQYVTFQEENFDNYQMELSEIKITDIERIESLPGKFDSYLQEDDYQEAYEASVNYILSFRILASTHEREVDTETYIVKFNDGYYLVWDPSVIEDDDPGAEIE